MPGYVLCVTFNATAMRLKLFLFISLALFLSESVAQNTYQVGDLFVDEAGNRGIVFYLLPNQTGGWVVALDDVDSMYQWGEWGWDVPDIIEWNNNLTDTSGYGNTLSLRNLLQGDLSPYGVGHVDFQNGWYVPAITQLMWLFAQLPFIESKFALYGGTTLSGSLYMSSSEISLTAAACLDFQNGKPSNFVKNAIRKLRAVRSFSYYTVNYDSTLTYQWNTGSTQPYITPSPSQTTTYTVTVTNGSGCSTTGSQTIFVGTNSPQEVEDVVCQYQDYEGYGFFIPAEQNTPPGTYVYADSIFADSCASWLVLRLTVLPGDTGTPPPQVLTSCGPYNWNGVTYYESGVYQQTFPVPGRPCDITYTLDLTVLPPDTTYLTVTACDSFILDGTLYSYSGTFTQYVSNSNGCDSVVVLDLTILPSQQTNIDTTVYNVLQWDDSVWNESGSYTVTYTNQYSCDSILTLNVTVIQLDTTYVDSTVCDYALPLVWNGVTFNEAGTETVTLHPTELYDSVVVMTLHVNPTVTEFVEATVCDSYEWAGETYTQSGEYTRTFSTIHGCDSVVTLHLTVNPSVTELIEVTVCDSYEWAGETYTQSGEYTRTFSTVHGCDSVVTLHLTVHYAGSVHLDTVVCPQSLPVTVRGFTFTEAGTQTVTLPDIHGCDSTSTVHVEVSDTSAVTTALTVCDSYLWYSTTYTESGVYEHTAYNVLGCPYTRRIDLTVNYSDTVAVERTCCQNELPLSWNGRVFSTAGTQSQILQTAGGCDSVVVMTLYVNGSHFTTFDTTVCGQFEWGGETYTHSGNFAHTFHDTYGCDSVVFAHVTVMQPPVTVFDTTVCVGDMPVTWHGHLFEHSDTLTFTATSALGCDSTAVFRLRTATPDTMVLHVSACDVFEWNGEEYYESDTLTELFTNIHGCDSTVTVYLTVNSSVASSFEASACDNYTWAGVTYTESGDYTRTFPNLAGCDSVVTLHLTVFPSVMEFVEATVCEDSLPYTWNGITFNNAGTQPVTLQTVDGCDSVIAMTLHVANRYELAQERTVCEDSLPYTWNGIAFNNAGTQSVTMQTVDGCDSVVAMTLHVANRYELTQERTVCADSLPYIWNGIAFNNAGTQFVTMQTVDGCDSVIAMTLHVANRYELAQERTVCEDSLPYIWNGVTFNNAGTQSVTMPTVDGCDSVIAMTLHVANRYDLTQERTVCADSLPYIWNGVAFNNAGTQSVTMQTVGGCDSVIAMTLHVANRYELTQERTVCEDSLPYIWNGVTFNNAGTQSVTMQTVDGCDSIITMTLYVSNVYQQAEQRTICQNELPYQWNGVTFHNAGTQTITLQTVGGCDSTVTMTLHVSNTYQQAEQRTVCQDELPYSWNGKIFNTAGTQNATLQTIGGCDSIITMTLHVSNTYQQTEQRTVCQDELPYVWNGRTFNAAGTQIVTLQTVGGCDSTITMTLHVSSTYQQSEYRTVCQNELPYVWNGATFDSAGLQSVTLQTVSGCDSLVTMTLSVSDTNFTEVYESACDSFAWNGVAYTESGDYTKTLSNSAGCDSVVTMHLTIHNTNHSDVEKVACDHFDWESATYTESGDYERILTNMAGCDSVVTLHLTVIDTALEIISLTEDFCEGMSAELVAVTTMTDYLWSTGEELPNITVTAPGVYSVTASQGGCRATARYTVEACDFQLWLPNAITPSKNDGLNDVFCLPPRTQNMISDFEISIFNRWGELVFYSTDKSFQWDGSVEEKVLVGAVYNYLIRCTVNGKPHRVMGSVTVL